MSKKTKKEDINSIWTKSILSKEPWITRHIFTDEKSNKFWEYAVFGTKTLVRYGRIGSNGALHQKTYDTNSEAKEAMQKLKQEKIKKGYILAKDLTVSKNKVNESNIENKSNTVKANTCTKRNPSPPCANGFMIKENKKGDECCYKDTKPKTKKK